MQSTIKKVALIGNFPPRRCGIATFTNNLAQAITEQHPAIDTFVVAMTDNKEGYDYPEQVRFEICEKDLDTYYQAADYLRINEVDIISLQHEFGIFGGTVGSHIIELLRQVRVPVVTTLHTVLEEPTREQYRVTRELARLSNRLVVMSQRGMGFLKDVYGTPLEKVDFIPHGIRDMPFVDPNFYKDKLEAEGRFVLLTFGLLSKNKGIENVIRALPKIIARHPEVVYVILGETHPNVIRQEGEAYRNFLIDLAKKMQVVDHVRFINRFVSEAELEEYIGAADVYITPYLSEQQITSGTLAYTVGAGKAVISTPYWYAEELLGDGRGILVPFADSDAIVEQVINLIENESYRHALRKRAYQYGREMVWSKVAQAYMETFEKARTEPKPQPGVLLVPEKLNRVSENLPPVNFNHMIRMTDNTGLLQHAFYTLPNYAEGYTTDDNARALMVTVMLERLGDSWLTGAEDLGQRYLTFINYAFNVESGRFRNFMSFDRRWLERIGSEDSHGRALWALGLAASRSNQETIRTVASILFGKALPGALELSSPRAWAFSLLGISEYLNRFAGDRSARRAGKELAQRLMDIYLSTSSPEWHWFENVVTYSNASLPHALIAGGHWLNRDDMVQTGLEALTWLTQLQTVKNVFAPIGNKGFYHRGGKPAVYDQQPVDAFATLAACIEAYRVSRDSCWQEKARAAFRWFMGANLLGLPLYDPQTGGCRDGLQPDRVNQNEGAESTLSFQLSLLELRSFEHYLRTGTETPDPVTILPVNVHLPPET